MSRHDVCVTGPVRPKNEGPQSFSRCGMASLNQLTPFVPNPAKISFMSLEPRSQEYRNQLEHKYGPDRAAAFKKEFPVVEEYFVTLVEKIGHAYAIDRVLAVGGTGIVHVGHHKRFAQTVVVKINRPNFDSEADSMVAHEAKLLPTLSHPNIVGVLDLLIPEEKKDGGSASTLPLTYIVEPFATGSKPLFKLRVDKPSDTWLHERLDRIKRSMPDQEKGRDANDVGMVIGLATPLLRDIAALFSQWVDLLAHVHAPHEGADRGYVYLDVKPENVLVDDYLHLTSIDYGSLEKMDPDDNLPVDVYFTKRYAHPGLRKHELEGASSNRVRGAPKRSQLRQSFDYYALGISLLEVLNEVARAREHVIPQLPLYRSLHFLATRLLDGQNNRRSREDQFEFAQDVFPGLGPVDYERLGYNSLSDTHRDFDKERGRWNLEEQVPELAAFSKDIVRIVPNFNTVITPRLRRVIEHPLVGRLKYVTQLGLASLVYPTADHARYDHALGSYTYTTYYVKSLFNDLGNPLFRNLVSEEDVNAVLLGALLHDLGQYPLAHDLEEIHEGVFKHTTIGASLLGDSEKDGHGHTLLDIVTDPKHGWGVRAETLRSVIRSHSKNLSSIEDLATEQKENEKRPLAKTDVLAAIIDGPIDADKADYIIRDSARCELPYGDQLDVERLLRVLTVAIIPREAAPPRRVTLGVYDKGLASAHAFGQARYQLMSTVYWHHTVRIAKAMLQYATTIGLPGEVFAADPEAPARKQAELQLRERLLHFIKSLVPPFPERGEPSSPKATKNSMDLTARPSDVVLESFTTEEPASQREHQEREWYPGIAWTDWLMLQWIAELPGATTHSRNLLAGIRRRRLYKRVATFPRGVGNDGLIQKLEDLRWAERLRISSQLSLKPAASATRIVSLRTQE